MYRLGIARKVDSTSHLKDRFTEFQKRMLSASTQLSAQEQVTTSQPLGTTVGQRKVLGETSRSKTVSRPTAAERPRPTNGRMQIFVDPTGEASVQAEHNAWPELGTRVSRTKENRPEVHKMAEGPLKSRTVTVHPRATFVPFRDTDATPMTPAAAPSSLNSFPEKIAGPPLTSKASFTPFQDEVRL